MDPKSQAKSKRIHTKHAKQSHPSPSSIAHKKKPSAAADGKPPRSRSRDLPSNWDRYDDEEKGEDGLEAQTATTGKKSDGEVVPKSKGADFAWLVEQARSQPAEQRSVGSGFSSSPDEISIDFVQGASSLLSVRGKGLLSWSTDDNFIVDDDSASNFEVPFLSLDLHALAAQLSKLKMSQRLFIEADLLPEELENNESEKNKASKQPSQSKASDEHHDLDATASPNHSSSGRDENNHNECSSETYMDHSIAQRMGNLCLQTPLLQATKPDGTECPTTTVDDSAVRGQPEPTSSLKMHEDRQRKLSGSTRFEAPAAEAELDMLLDSFHGNNSSISYSLANNNTSTKASDSSSLKSVFPSSVRCDRSTLRHLAGTSLDDELDDLLAKTSSRPPDPQHMRHVAGASLDNVLDDLLAETASLPTRDDHSTSTRVPETSLDSALDDLLAETSPVLQHQQKDTAASSIDLPPSSQGPKPMDDFDSWLDTL